MRVALITGGGSAEREIALRSAQTVRSVLGDRVELIMFDFPRDRVAFQHVCDKVDAVVPVMHGRGGAEDGELQRWLDGLGVPYIFSSARAHEIGMDKPRASQVVASVGLLVPDSFVVKPVDTVEYVHPVVVKPVDGGSSQGVAIVRSAQDLERALHEGFRHSERLLVEDFVEGREFTVGVIEDRGVPIALPVTEIIVTDGFFDFQAKYDTAHLAKEICPADVSKALLKELHQAGVAAHQAIGARHLSRSDFLVDASGRVFFLEINTIPGLTETSLLPRMIEKSGRDLGVLLVQWLHECTV